MSAPRVGATTGAVIFEPFPSGGDLLPAATAPGRHTSTVQVFAANLPYLPR